MQTVNESMYIYEVSLFSTHVILYIYNVPVCVCERKRKEEEERYKMVIQFKQTLDEFRFIFILCFFSVLDIYFFKDPSRQRTSKKKKRRFFYLVYVFSSLMDYWAAPVFMPALNKITGMIDWTRKWLTLMCGANDILYEVLNLTSVHFVARKWSVITEQFFSWIYLFNKQLANSDFLFLLSLTTPLFFHIFLYFNRL